MLNRYILFSKWFAVAALMGGCRASGPQTFVASPPSQPAASPAATPPPATTTPTPASPPSRLTWSPDECPDRKPVAVAIPPVTFVSDGDYAYFPGELSIVRVPLAGGAPETLVKKGRPLLSPTLSGDDLLFLEDQADGPWLWSVSAAGGSPTSLGRVRGRHVFPGGDRVYFLGDHEQGEWALSATPKKGGPATLVVHGLTKDHGAPAGVVADGEGVYWLDQGGVVRALGDGRGEALADSSIPPGSLALDAIVVQDATHIYWWARRIPTLTAPLFRVAKAGGQRRTLLADAHIEALAVYGDFIYFAARGRGPMRIGRLSINGGNLGIIACYDPDFPGIVVNGTGVYVAAHKSWVRFPLAP